MPWQDTDLTQEERKHIEDGLDKNEALKGTPAFGKALIRPAIESLLKSLVTHDVRWKRYPEGPGKHQETKYDRLYHLVYNRTVRGCGAHGDSVTTIPAQKM